MHDAWRGCPIVHDSVTAIASIPAVPPPPLLPPSAGYGTNAGFFGPSDLAFDSQGFLHVVDIAGNHARKVDVFTGRVTTVRWRRWR